MLGRKRACIKPKGLAPFSLLPHSTKVHKFFDDYAGKEVTSTLSSYSLSYQTQEAPTIINKMNNTTINANPPPKATPSAIIYTSYSDLNSFPF